MDVAMASMGMQAMQMQMAVGTSMAKKTMDVAEMEMAGVLQMMPPAPSIDGLGANIDVSV